MSSQSGTDLHPRLLRKIKIPANVQGLPMCLLAADYASTHTYFGLLTLASALFKVWPYQLRILLKLACLAAWDNAALPSSSPRFRQDDEPRVVMIIHMFSDDVALAILLGGLFLYPRMRLVDLHIVGRPVSEDHREYSSMASEVEPFRISISDSEAEDRETCLSLTRNPDESQFANQNYDALLEDIKRLAKY
ncbi:hypothetical protein KEM54_000902 [Ascosphaera aggregata]|nr:hypothetical protein KEM54_000902 [Ascosphaera aggregata]